MFLCFSFILIITILFSAGEKSSPSLDAKMFITSKSQTIANLYEQELPGFMLEGYGSAFK